MRKLEDQWRRLCPDSVDSPWALQRALVAHCCSMWSPRMWPLITLPVCWTPLPHRRLQAAVELHRRSVSTVAVPTVRWLTAGVMASMTWMMEQISTASGDRLPVARARALLLALALRQELPPPRLPTASPALSWARRVPVAGASCKSNQERWDLFILKAIGRAWKSTAGIGFRF